MASVIIKPEINIVIENSGGSSPSSAASSSPILPYNAKAVSYDGTDYFSQRLGTLTGNINGQKGIASGWFKANSNLLSDRTIYSNWGAAFRIYLDGTNFHIFGTLKPNGNLDLASVGFDYSNSTVWHHFVAAWDTANGSGGLWIDNVLQTGGTGVPSTGNLVDYISEGFPTNNYIGGRSGVTLFNACLSDLYLNTSEFIDLTIESNRRKFIDTFLKPVDLGNNGELVTGITPIMFLTGNAATFLSNVGSGGMFVTGGSVTTGVLTDCGSSPSD